MKIQYVHNIYYIGITSTPRYSYIVDRDLATQRQRRRDARMHDAPRSRVQYDTRVEYYVQLVDLEAPNENVTTSRRK